MKRGSWWWEEALDKGGRLYQWWYDTLEEGPWKGAKWIEAYILVFKQGSFTTAGNCIRKNSERGIKV